MIYISFILLTPKNNNAGINIKFCKNKLNIQTKNIPFPSPRVKVTAATVYPKQKPLNKIIPKTIGMPIIVVPAIQSAIAKIILSFIDVVSKFSLSKFAIDLNFSIYVFKI